MVTTCMDIEITQPYEDWIVTIKKLRNDIIGSNKRKKEALLHVPKLLEFIEDRTCPVELKIDSTVVLGSIARGTASQVQTLYEKGTVEVLLKCLSSDNLKFTEVCISCIRHVVCKVETAKDLIFKDDDGVSKLVSLLSKSNCCKECISIILSQSCKTLEQQYCLLKNGAISNLVQLLATSSYRVLIATLRCLAVLSWKNLEVSQAITSCLVGDLPVVDFLLKLHQRDKTIETQLCAARCLTNLYRAEVTQCQSSDVVYKVLSTLIFICQPDKMWIHRCEGAYYLSYLTQKDIHLQYIASISGQILAALSDYFNYAINNFDSNITDTYSGSTLMSCLDEQNLSNELRSAAFLAYASLAANNEDMRKKIMESSSLKQYLVEGVTDADIKVQYAALKCLLSLSRSVHQLRTSFHDKKIGNLVFDIFMAANDEPHLIVATALLCNLLVDFCPCKEQILSERDTINTEYGTVERHSVVVLKLLKLTRSEIPSIKLSAIWCIMNLTYSCPDEEKNSLLASLRNDDVFHLIRSNNVEIVMKTLGTIRNLLSSESQSVDYVMERIGRKVMESVVLVLEGDFPVEVKEQALCILTNISSGDSSKNFIMGNSDVLGKIINYLVHDCLNLQLAANDSIYNLVNRECEDSGYCARQETFNQLQVRKVLQSLLSESNPQLIERVKQTLNQF